MKNQFFVVGFKKSNGESKLVKRSAQRSKDNTEHLSDGRSNHNSSFMSVKMRARAKRVWDPPSCLRFLRPDRDHREHTLSSFGMLPRISEGSSSKIIIVLHYCCVTLLFKFSLTPEEITHEFLRVENIILYYPDETVTLDVSDPG